MPSKIIALADARERRLARAFLRVAKKRLPKCCNVEFEKKLREAMKGEGRID